MKNLLRILMAAGMILFSPALHADNYPSKPITIIVPFGPGSATDTISRVIGQLLGTALNQSVVVEPRPGANGALAALYVARSAPDGYTLFMSTNSPHSAVPFLMKNVAYDPVKDFVPVSRAGSYTLMLCVHPGVPAKSVKELIEYVKANPGKLSFASANTSGIVAGETLKHWAEIDMLHVPYKSTPPALNDLLAGRVSMMFVDLTSGLPHVKAGNAARTRGHALQAQHAVSGTADLGRSRRHRLRHGFLGRHFRSRPIRRRRSSRGSTPSCARSSTIRTSRRSSATSVSRRFRARRRSWSDFVKVQLGKWGKMVKDAGIQPE